MKRLIIILLLLVSLGMNAQNRSRKVSYNDDKSGLVICSVGVLFATIAVTVPDGSEWTWKQTGPYTSQRVYKPAYQNPSRVVMFCAGITVSIGGLIYNKSNKH